MLKTVPQKTFTCSIFKETSLKLKIITWYWTAHLKLSVLPWTLPRTVLLDWSYRRPVRRDQGLWILSTSAGGEQLSVGFQSWHFGWRLGTKLILLCTAHLFWEAAPSLPPQRVQEEPWESASISIRVCVESKRALRTVSKSIHPNMRGQQNWDLFIFHFPLVQGRCF